jgi:hypothetical protein
MYDENTYILRRMVQIYEKCKEQEVINNNELSNINVILRRELWNMEEGKRVHISNTYFNKDANTIRWCPK